MSTDKLLHMNTLNEISEMMGKVKSLNEAVMFEGDYEDEREMEPSFDNSEDDVESYTEEEPKTCEVDCDEMNDIDCIREIALKGMLKHVKNSSSPEYETLKKIFQFCDKVNNEKPEDAERR